MGVFTSDSLISFFPKRLLTTRIDYSVVKIVLITDFEA